MIIWSFYTEGTEYEDEAAKLYESLVKLNLNRFIIEPVPNLGDWQLNVKQRVKLIRQLMEARKESVLAVDCDATFCRKPDLDFDSLHCDIAAHVMDKAYWKQDISKHTHSLMGGTLFFPCEVRTLDLLYLWDKACENNPMWDQRILERVIKEHGFRLYELPAEYCCIDKTMWGIENPVIRHHQASRRLRKVINEISG